jgi:hypothetical protein
MNEAELRRELAASASRAFPDDSRLSIDVVSLAVASRPAVRARRGLRVRLAVVAAVAVAALGAAGAVAVANGTFPVRFNLIEAGRPEDKVAASLDPAEQAPLEAKKRAAAESESKPPSSQDKREAIKNRPQLVEMSLAEAEVAFGSTLLLPAGLEPIAIHYLEMSGQAEHTKPGAPPPADTVELKFALPGGTAMVFEERDTSAESLTVDALNQDGPMMKTDEGLGRAAIESVDGGSYVVGYTVDGQNVATVVFKSTAGVAVTIRFQPGVTHDAALAFARSLQ